MNSLLKAFKEFYNEINGATLTGAIDVIVVEQPDGSFICSPFHVRFGKLGVLRSREKIVDIEVNGEPVNIHMKLGESGEAFFVQECEDNDLDELPANLATSPLPTDEFSQNYNDGSEEQDTVSMKIRRNSTALLSPSPQRERDNSEIDNFFMNQTSDYRKKRRHSELFLESSILSQKNLEFTTEQIRQELAAREASVLASLETNSEADPPTNEGDAQTTVSTSAQNDGSPANVPASEVGENGVDAECHETKGVPVKKPEEEAVTNTKEVETKSKKKRRKKSMMKKKSSLGNVTAALNAIGSAGITNNTTTTSNRKSSLSSSGGSASAGLCDQNDADTESNQQSSNATSASIDDLAKSELAATANGTLNDSTGMPEPMENSRICDLHFFSDTEVATSPYGSRPSTPIQSDSEFEISQRDKLVKNEKNSENMSNSRASWQWGELPVTPAKTDVDNPLDKDAKQADRNSTLSTMLSFMKETMKMRKSSSEGVYLSDLVDTNGMDPDVVAMYFPPKNQSFAATTDADDHESGNGTSLPHSPSSMDGTALKRLEFDFEQDGKLYDKNVIALSLCGGLDRNGPTEEEFDANLIEYSEVCSNPAIFSSPLLVVRLCGKYYSWLAACPIVMTAIAYRKPLSTEAIEQLMNSSKTSSPTVETSIDKIDNKMPSPANKNRRSSWWNWRRSNDNAGQTDAAKVSPGEGNELEKFDEQNASGLSGADLDAIDNKNDDSINSELNEISKNSFMNEKCRKTLRLTTDQIESLHLKPGMNELEFSVTTAYQGTSRCKCYVFRWKHTDKVIISDIDGTITKSDVLGHILPMVGKDWAQLGVAELFTKIEQNGYKLLYLSARAIGQSRATRDYLRSIQQGDVKLPDGPLLLNPTSLISAFHREVIERKPEQFKIACLSDIKALFPTNPFYAGYGNRINDVWAYRAVGIPIIRIFTINPKGELKHELNKTFQSSYRGMTYIVDQLFPPINDREESVEFSNFNFWREPVLEIDCDHLLDTSTNAIATADQLPRVCHLPATPMIDAELTSIPENIKG